MLKTSSKSCLQASQFALIKLLFAYFKQPKQIFLLKMEPSFDSFFAFFKQFNFYGAANANGTQGLQPVLDLFFQARQEVNGQQMENHWKIF